jgi:hypothetical protein
MPREDTASSQRSGGSVIAFDGTWKASGGAYSELVPKHVIVPVYHKIRVTFLDVQKWITAFNYLAEKVIANFDELEWDVHLTTINDLKQAMRQKPTSKARDRILLNPGPRFLWHAVLQTPAQPAVELLLDATDMDRSYPFVDVLFHDNDFREKLKVITHATDLQAVLGELVTPQFRDFLKELTE